MGARVTKSGTKTDDMPDPDQLGMIKTTLRSLIDGPFLGAVLEHAPEFMAN